MNSFKAFTNALVKRFSFPLAARSSAPPAGMHWYPLAASRAAELSAHPLLIPRVVPSPWKNRALWQRLLELSCVRHGDAFICCIAAAPFVRLPEGRPGG